MSLINNMLNELENNKKPDSTHKSVLSSIKPAIRKQKGTIRWKMILWIAAIIIVVGFVWQQHQEIALNLTKTFDIIKAGVFTKKTIEPIEPIEPITPTATKKALPKSPQPSIELQSLIIEQKKNKTILDFVLSAATTYYIDQSPNGQELSISLSDTRLLGNLPIVLENTFLMSLSTVQNKNNVQITIALLPGTIVDEIKLITDPKPALHLIFSNPQITNSVMSKTPAPLSPEEIEIKKLKEIQELLAENKIHNAIHKLHLFVGDFPNNLQARSLLVSLLIKTKRLRKADEILTIGLDKHQNYTPFVKLKTNILIKQNNPAAAINLLEQNMAITSDVELLALLAILYQQQEHFMLAAQAYNQLTKIEPEESRWWVGLGIALEDAGKLNAAKEAYKLASNKSNIPAELRGFLNEKLKK